MSNEQTYKLPCQTEGCTEEHILSFTKDTTIHCKCGETFNYVNDTAQNLQSINASFVKDVNKLFK